MQANFGQLHIVVGIVLATVLLLTCQTLELTLKMHHCHIRMLLRTQVARGTGVQTVTQRLQGKHEHALMRAW